MTTTSVPLRERINWRIVLFAGVVLLLVGYPLYFVLDSMLFHGVHEAKDELGSYKVVQLKELSGFEMNQLTATDADIPPHWRQLDGQRVALTGEMYLANSAGRQNSFDLVYSIAKCCVTPSPKIQHFIKSTVMPGRRVSYHPGLVEVKGTLHVGIEREGEQILSVYRLDVENVRPVN